MYSTALLVCDAKTEPCGDLEQRLRRAGYEVIVHDSPGYVGLDFAAPRLYLGDMTVTGVPEIERIAAQFEAENSFIQSEFISEVAGRLSQTPSFSAARATEILGSDVLSESVASARLIVLERAGEVRVPSFQIDEAGHGMVAAAAQVNMILGAGSDPLGVLSWWLTENARLDGRAPVELLGREEPTLIELARGTVELGG